MSVGGSEASDASDLGLGASEAPSQGGAGASGQGGAGGRDSVDLQDKLFGSSPERRTSVRQLIFQPEKAHFWNDLELGHLEGDDFVLYEVISNKTSGGRTLWQVRRRGTNEQPKDWDVKHITPCPQKGQKKTLSYFFIAFELSIVLCSPPLTRGTKNYAQLKRNTKI
jgi:hypothetical protein